MKIAMFSDNFYPEMSGVSDSIITTAKKLAERGHRINFYVPSHPKENFILAKLKPEEIDLGAKIKIFRMPSVFYPTPTKAGRLALPLLSTCRHIKKFNPDFIHTHHNFGAGIEALMVSRLLKIPLVGTNHTPMSEFMKYGPIKSKWAEKAMLKYVSWLYNKCIWVSSPCQAIISEMRQYGFKKYGFTMSNPINVSAFNPADDVRKSELKKKYNLSGKTILYTGRLAEEKKVDDVIRAIAIAKDKFPEVSLAITGLGNAEENLKKLVKELGLEKNTNFFGYVESSVLSEYYQASDIFAVMSTAETQCISMMQAMATGLPVIGANAWGLPEYISPECGYIVEPGDYKSLAEKIIYLFDHPEEMKKLGQGGIKHVKNFSEENIMLKWEKIYQEQLEKIKAGAPAPENQKLKVQKQEIK
jgi:glycosyltransferase involved in cell wall biosynthesis